MDVYGQWPLTWSGVYGRPEMAKGSLSMFQRALYVSLDVMTGYGTGPAPVTDL